MARRRPGRTLPMLLLALCLVLGWFVYQGLRADSRLPPAPLAGGSGGESLDEIPSLSAFVLPPPAHFQVILERPLFSPTRRPPAQGTETVAAPEAALKLDLVGVVISGGEKIALIVPQGGTAIQRLATGDTFQGWLLESIEPERVTFRRGEIEEQIELSFDRPPPVKTPKQRREERRKKRQQQRQEQQNRSQQDRGQPEQGAQPLAQ